MNKDFKIYDSKVTFYGSEGSGKSSLIKRLTDFTWIFGDSVKTIGVEYACIPIKHNNTINKLQIWDTSGQEKFRALTESFMRGSMVVCLAWNPKIDRWFEDLEYFYTKAKEDAPTAAIIVVRTKADVEVAESDLEAQHQQIRNRIGDEFQLVVTSAKNQQGLHNLLDVIDKTTFAMHTQIPKSYQMNDGAAAIAKTSRRKFPCCCLWTSSPKPLTETDNLVAQGTENDFGL